jgi:putative MFS transporter
MVVLTVALVIDVMKPASLGFVVPGMQAEYARDERR